MRRFKLFENNESTLKQVKNIIDENQIIPDKNVTLDKIIESDNWIIYISKQTMDHIESHLAPSVEIGDAPGSYYTKNWKEGIKKIISDYEPQVSDKAPFRTAWIGLNAGVNVGYVTIGLSDQLASGNLEGFKRYTYDRPVRNEIVKETIVLKVEEASPTSFMTIVGSKIGEVNGKGLVSLWTTYPDFKDGKIDGSDIPMERNQFEEKGFYFKCTQEFFDKVPMNESLRYLKSYINFK